MEMECGQAGFSLWLPGPSKHHGFCQPQSCISESTCFSQIGECKDGGWLARRYLSGKATTSRPVMASSSSSSGEARLQGRRRRRCETPLPLLKAETPQLATGEVALLYGRSDQHSNGQERRSGNAELRDCPLHSQEPCRFQTDNLGVECMYTLHCVQAARNGQTLLKCS